MAEACKTIKTGILYRSLPFERTAIDKEKRTVSMTCSSETPVERWFGYEVLDHAEKSVDLSRLRILTESPEKRSHGQRSDLFPINRFDTQTS
jgi:hypothetical protein